MSLGVFQNNNLTDYIRGGKFAAAIDADTTWLSTSFSGESRNGLVWLDRIGLWQLNYKAAGSRDGVVRIDPLLIDNTSAAIVRVADPNALFVHMGAYVPSTGEGRLFGVSGNGSPGNPWQVVDYNDITNILNTNVFPNVTQRTNQVAGFISTDDGYYDTIDQTEWLFFEGWDHDGSGNTVGTALILQASVRAGGVTYTNVPALVNLDTGFATPLAGMPTLYQTTPANDFQSGELFGLSAATFDALQFLPDDDSTRSAPKGQVFMSGFQSSAGLGTHLMKTVEWNPTAKAGTPVRIHLKERLVTRFIVDLQASTASFPGATSNEIPSTAGGANRMKVNRQTGRPTLVGSTEQGSNVGPFNSQVFHSVLLEATPEAIASAVTKPAPRQSVTTNRVVIVGTEAIGDLGERVASQDVAWTLRRVTTRAEVLATTPVLGETVTVANVPIDRNSNFPFAVKKDGVAMTEGAGGTEYTVNEALGQITFGAAEPVGGSVYTIDYAHPTVPVLPPFGQLLVATAVTDENGEAFTRVRYADEPLNAGFVDQLDVDTV